MNNELNYVVSSQTIAELIGKNPKKVYKEMVRFYDLMYSLGMYDAWRYFDIDEDWCEEYGKIVVYKKTAFLSEEGYDLYLATLKPKKQNILKEAKEELFKFKRQAQEAK